MRITQMRALGIDENEVIRLYEQYETAREVCARVGCSDETVYRILKRHGIPRTHRHEKQREPILTSNCKTKYCPALVRLLHVVGGYSTREIADMTAVPLVSVCNILRTKYPDVFRSRNNAARAVDVDALERDYLAGATTYECAEKYGVDHKTVSKWMRKRGHFRDKGHSASQQRSHERAVAVFLSIHQEHLDRSKSARERAYIRRRYRIVSRPHDGPSSGLTWRDVYEHNGHNLTCWICGKTCDPSAIGDEHPSIDHVVPLSNGGTDTFGNVRIAHVGCNRDRNNKTQLTLDYLLYETR